MDLFEDLVRQGVVLYMYHIWFAAVVLGIFHRVTRVWRTINGPEN